MRGKVIVEIESAVEAGSQRLAVENDRADEGGGAISVPLQQLGQRGMARRQRHGKIGDAMGAGQQARQDRGMRSVGDRAGSERLGKANAVFRQCIERRGLNALVPVAVNVVGAKGVNGDQENVGLGCPFLRLSGPWQKRPPARKQSISERPSRISD